MHAQKQKEPRTRNTKLLSELLSVISLCRLNGALRKVTELVMNWMNDYGVAIEALKVGTAQLIHSMEEEMDMMFNVEWLRDKHLPHLKRKRWLIQTNMLKPLQL